MPSFRLSVMNYLGKILVTYPADNVTDPNAFDLMLAKS